MNPRFARYSLLVSSFALGLSGAACGSPQDDEDTDQLGAAATDGPPTVLEDVHGTAAFRVRAASMSVWVEPLAATTRIGGELRTTLRIRTSRSIESAASWVPDDGFGDARIVSPRVIEVDLRGGHEVNTALSGLPLFVHLRTTTGASRDYDVRLDLAPRFQGFSGSSAVHVDADLRPVYVAHTTSNLRYRGFVRATGATAMGTEIAGAPVPGLFPLGIGTGSFRFDWEYGRAEPAITSPGSVLFRATIAGDPVTKTAALAVRVARLGLTMEGADHAWPTESCKPTVKGCVQAGGDLGACGTYREVARCVDSLACSFSLSPRSVTSLNATRKAVNAACSARAGGSCTLDRFRSYDPGGCPDGAPSIDDVAALVEAETDAEDPRFSPAQTLSRAQLAQTPYFASYAPALLAKLDAYAGPGNLVARAYVTELPCHNCSAYAVRYVIFYTDTQRVVVVDGSFSHD